MSTMISNLHSLSLFPLEKGSSSIIESFAPRQKARAEEVDSLSSRWAPIFEQRVEGSCAELEEDVDLLERRRAKQWDMFAAAEERARQLQSEWEASEGRFREALDQTSEALTNCDERSLRERTLLQQEIDRVQAEHRRDMFALEARIERWAQVDFRPLHELFAVPTLREDIGQLELEFADTRRLLQDFYEKLEQLEPRFSALEQEQQQVSVGLADAEVALQHLSQEIAATRREWEQYQKRAEMLFKVVVGVAACCMLGVGAINALSSQAMALAPAAGEVATAGIYLEGGTVAFKSALFGVPLVGGAVLCQESEKEKPRAKSKPQESSALENLASSTGTEWFSFGGAPHILDCIENLQSFRGNYGYTYDLRREVPKIIANRLANRTCPQENIEEAVNHALQGKWYDRLVWRYPMVEEIKQCAVSASPPKTALYSFSNAKHVEQCLRTTPVLGEVPSSYFQGPEVIQEMATQLAHTTRSERQIAELVRKMLAARWLTGPFEEKLFTAFKQCAGKVEQGKQHSRLPSTSGRYAFSTQEQVAGCLEKCPELSLVPYFRDYPVLKNLAAEFANTELSEREIAKRVRKMLADHMLHGCFEEQLVKAFKECASKVEEGEASGPSESFFNDITKHPRYSE